MRVVVLFLAIVLAFPARAAADAPAATAGCAAEAARADALQTSLAATVATVDEAAGVASGMGAFAHGANYVSLQKAFDAALHASGEAYDAVTRAPASRVAGTYATAFHHVRAYAASLASFGVSLERTGPADVQSVIAYGEVLPRPETATSPYATLPWRRARDVLTEHRPVVAALPAVTRQAADAVLTACRARITSIVPAPACDAYVRAAQPAAAALADGLRRFRALGDGTEASQPIWRRPALERERAAVDAAADRAAAALAAIPPGLCTDANGAARRHEGMQALVTAVRLGVRAMRAYGMGPSGPQAYDPGRGLLGAVLGGVKANVGEKSDAARAEIATRLPWLRATVDDAALVAEVVPSETPGPVESASPHP